MHNFTLLGSAVKPFFDGRGQMREISITDAGLVLQMRYHAVRDLALRGILRARRNEAGRLVVSAESVNAYRDRATVGTAA